MTMMKNTRDSMQLTAEELFIKFDLTAAPKLGTVQPGDLKNNVTLLFYSLQLTF